MNCLQLIRADKPIARKDSRTLQITVAVLVVMLAVAVGYGYSKYSKVQLLNSEVETLNSEVETLNSEVETLNSEVETLNSEVETLNSEVETLNSEVETLNSEVEILEAENEQLIETKRRSEAHMLKVKAMKLTSETHVANTADRLMNMLKSVQDSMADSRGDSVKDLRRELRSVRDGITELAAIVSPHYQAVPTEIIINDFRKKKQANEEWYSSPFYNHHGYKFRLIVYPNGNRVGSGSHLSVFAQLMRGEYDNELEWPFQGDIRVELLNWRADKNHHSRTICFDRLTDRKYSSRVTDQKVGSAYGKLQFISHTDLVPTTNTEYLRDDYLKLRVSAIVYSTPLLPLTPAWQDSLSTTQSGAQFTISQYSKRKQLDNEYYSPPFTTSPQGFRFCLKVCANGDSSGKGSHLSIYAHIMKGQHDDHLQWPFTGTIIIELLNWLEDKYHYKKTLSIDTNMNLVRVTKGEYGNGRGYHQSISQSFLNSSTVTNPQYLYQDCIRVRVQAIAND